MQLLNQLSNLAFEVMLSILFLRCVKRDGGEEEKKKAMYFFQFSI